MSLLIADDVFTARFCCDLEACSGICCVEGDSGAPLEEEECELLERDWGAYKPFMQPAGIAAIEEQGTWVLDRDNDQVTPLIHGKECAYAVFDEKGVCLCAIEKAYRAGLTTFKKPISCRLYPIRIQKLPNNSLALNYHRWHLCEAACQCGKERNINLISFLREPLIDRFGEDLYNGLLEAANNRG